MGNSKDRLIKELKALSSEIEKHNRLYYVDDKPSISDAAYDRLLMMARKLYRFVSPIMWLTLITGFWLWFAYFPIDMNWMWAKLALVVGLVGYHHVCKSLLRKFEARQNTKSHGWFRWFNEIPVIVLVVVVLLVVLKPF